MEFDGNNYSNTVRTRKCEFLSVSAKCSACTKTENLLVTALISLMNVTCKHLRRVIKLINLGKGFIKLNKWYVASTKDSRQVRWHPVLVKCGA